jgi:cyclophilin family peptidyl-prolyl cis-trans isomerase
MILDSIESFMTNLKSKVSNPFFGTLIAVWAIRNWNFVYGIFIFDKDCNMNDKFEFVRNHFKGKVFLYELLINIIITFGLLILGYFLLIISRFIANLVEHRITPNINRIAASKLVANKDILTELETQLLKKANDLIDERKLVNELELQLVDIRGRVEIATNEKNSANSKLFEQTKQNREGKKTIEILDNSIKVLNEELVESRNMASKIRVIAEICEELNTEKKISNTHINIYLTLWNYNLIKVFGDIITEFDKGEKKFKSNETNNALIKILNENKVITTTLNLEEKSTTVTYTELGEEFTKIFFTLKKEFAKTSLPW